MDGTVGLPIGHAVRELCRYADMRPGEIRL